MSRSRLIVSLVLWIIVAILLVGFAVYRTQSSVSCGAAQRLLDAGRIQEAEKDFLSLVQSQPQSTCASRGLALAVRSRCQAGRQMLEQGALDAAGRDFQTTLDAAPGARCGVDGLASVSRLQCERLAALAKFRPDLARTSAEDVVSKSPEASLFTCALGELALLPSPSASPSH